MVDLSTKYLGLDLKSPLLPSSSPLTGTLDGARQLEDAGAAALILPSLQANIRAGDLPEPEDNGVRYFKVPIDAL